MLRDIVSSFHLHVHMFLHLYVRSFVSSFPSYLDQGCHSQGKNLENDFFFQIREKSGNLWMDREI